MGGGGGGGPSKPARPEGFDDPWVPNARYEFGTRPATQDEYYEKGGPYWPRGGVDENGQFTEGAYSYNPVGRYNRSIMDFMKSGATVQPGVGGISDWLATVGARPEAPTPRPELMPGGYPQQHPATALQYYGGIQGGFSNRSSGGGSGDPSGGFAAPRGETPTPDRYVDDYKKAGLTPPGYVSKDWLMNATGGKGLYGLGVGQDYVPYSGLYQPIVPTKDVNGADKWVLGGHNRYSEYFDSPEDVPEGRLS